jgi:uncharacterized protein YbjT (DUF2867 family)
VLDKANAVKFLSSNWLEKMNVKTILVAGATGALGGHTVAALAARGWKVRVLARNGERAKKIAGVAEVRVADALNPNSLAGVFDGVDVAFSCVGASVDPSPMKGWASYQSVDVPANIHLIEAAKRSGVKRFVYVSLFADELMRRTLRYVDAHERVVEHLRDSGLDRRVLRPTGFFSAYGMLFDMAQRGVAPLMGDWTARTNPIHDIDLADACADAAEGTTPAEFSLGGPEVITRRDAVELAFKALGKAPRVVAVSAGMVRAMCVLMRPFLPRTADITAFVAHVSTHDGIAPPRGSRTLADYYRTRATDWGSTACGVRCALNFMMIVVNWSFRSSLKVCELASTYQQVRPIARWVLRTTLDEHWVLMDVR